jgi:hypothetical protein
MGLNISRAGKAFEASLKNFGGFSKLQASANVPKLLF